MVVESVLVQELAWRWGLEIIHSDTKDCHDS
jgi:hypothetical protein